MRHVNPTNHTHKLIGHTTLSKISLLTSILSFGALVSLLFFVSPQSKLSFITYTIPPLYLFLFVLFCFFFSFSSLLFKSKTHGLLIAFFVISYLVFRLNNLTHPFFFILLIAIFLTLELFFGYRKDPTAPRPSHE